MKQRAIVRVTWELLHDLLRLPEGVEIRGIASNTEDNVSERFRVILQGENLPMVEEGNPMPWVPLKDIAVTNDEGS